MIWWLTHRTRLSSEKEKITKLESEVEWLRVRDWYATKDLMMRLEFDVVIDGNEFQFDMIYPSVYPDSPPMIFTRDRVRLSGHQYGAEGELCLEYRPDNWQRSIMGSDMLQSCYKLLQVEKPNSQSPQHAPSAHTPSLGRDMRGHIFRFILTSNDIVELNRIEKETSSKGLIRLRDLKGIYRACLHKIGDDEGHAWESDLTLPDHDWKKQGILIVHVENASGLKSLNEDQFDAFASELKIDELNTHISNINGINYLLMGDDNEWILFCFFESDGQRKFIPYKTLIVDEGEQRLPEEFSELKDRSVAIIGCGSAGSKIASTLCRSGVKNYTLIDEDLFFPGNIERNELDLNDIGLHKSFALRSRLLKINPKAEIQVIRISLGGQESAKLMEGALKSLGEADIMIDATANAMAFNIISSVSTRQLKPVVWVEIFAGGIGGLVARSRPKIDPPPAIIRAQIEQWCQDQGVDWLHVNTRPYEATANSETPYIAGDAEVSLMASHAARFAIDILSSKDETLFPYSVYMVGMSSQWLFHQPFDTRPITLNPEGVWGDDPDPWDPDEAATLLSEHFRPGEKEDEDNSSH